MISNNFERGRGYRTKNLFLLFQRGHVSEENVICGRVQTFLQVVVVNAKPSRGNRIEMFLTKARQLGYFSAYVVYLHV